MAGTAIGIQVLAGAGTCLLRLPGTRAIAVGSFRTRTWTTTDGEQRSTLEVLAEDIGPSLRWATTQVARSPAR